MMTTSRGSSGGETFTFRPIGWGRYFDVIFLAAWLCGWLVGEVVVTWLFGAMLAGVVAGWFGVTVSWASRMTPDGSTPFFLLFMGVWLTFWTVGGLAAGTHFLRTVAGRDVVSVSSDGLDVDWRAGPFRWRRKIARTAIRRVRLGHGNVAIVADTETGSIDVATLGTLDDRKALLASVRKHLVLPSETEVKRLDAENPPPGWDVEVEGAETRLFHPTRRFRRNAAVILWILAALMFSGFLPALPALSTTDVEWLFNGDLIEQPRSRVTGAHITAGVFGLLFAAWAAWVTWGRSEWVVTHGRMIRRRRFGVWQSERLFENATLDIERTYDSDGDARFTLRVKTASASRKISTELHESVDLQRLAGWLSARTRFPIT